MKRVVVIFVLLFVFLCSCYNHYDIEIDDSDNPIYEENTSGTKYIASKMGKTYHLENCYIVRNMKEENIQVFYSKQFFIEREMSPCKKCKP